MGMEGDGTRKRELGTRKKKARIDCTKKCLRIHNKSQSVSDTSSFFKVMLGDFTQFMYIPPEFAQTMTDLVGTNIFLEDSSGARWRVLVCMKRRSLAFGHGWCDFVLGHSIDAGEFLVFRKATQSIFSVQIFSISGCERLNFCETKKRSQNRRKRIPNFVPNTIRSRESTKNSHIPTIQEATRREESRARRTNAVIRRLIMEDIADENLLVKEELPIIPPIATMPSDGHHSLCSSQNVKRLTINVATFPPLVECLDRPEDLDTMGTGRNAEANGTVCNGIKRGKCEADNITTNKKQKCLAKIIGEDQNIIQENNSVHNAASERQTEIQLTVPMEDKFTISAIENGKDLSVVKTEIVDFTEAPEPKKETFPISASITSQSWLLPARLPFTIGKNKVGRKVVILRDSSMQLWPVLYYETSKFAGFIDGWEEFKRANDICAGETCNFELCGASNEVLQVRISKKSVEFQTSN